MTISKTFKGCAQALIGNHVGKSKQLRMNFYRNLDKAWYEILLELIRTNIGNSRKVYETRSNADSQAAKKITHTMPHGRSNHNARMQKRENRKHKKIIFFLCAFSCVHLGPCEGWGPLNLPSGWGHLSFLQKGVIQLSFSLEAFDLPLHWGHLTILQSGPS